MVDVARLSVEVDTTDLKRGEASLRQFARTGEDVSRRTSRASRGVAQFGRQAQTAGRNLGGFNSGLRNTSLQLSQVVQQASAGGGLLRAFAIQLPDLAIAFGPLAIASAAVAGGLLSIAANGRKATDATAELIEELNGGTISLGSIRGQISQLASLQEDYTRAIEASAIASGSAAEAVVSNSKREFDARRQVLAVEVELLNIRTQEQREALRNFRDQARVQAQAARERLRSLGPGATARLDRDAEGFVNPSRSFDEIAREAGIDANAARDRRLAIRRLEAELELLGIAGDEARKALDGIFEDTGGGGAPSITRSARGAARAITEPRRALTELERVGVSAVGNVSKAFGDFVARGLQDFGGFVRSVLSSFQNLIAQMIAIAARNRILIGIGLGGTGATAASAGGVLNSVVSGAGGGFLGNVGTGSILGGFSGGSGLLGGFAQTAGGVFSGGGLSSLFNISGGAAAAGGGLAATIGAALPLVGVGLALFGLFRRKPPISAEDFRAIQTGLSLTGQELFDTGRAGQKAAADLKRIAGGIDEFETKTARYFDLFFTESEKRERAEEGLAQTFANLSIAAPRTNAEFRDIVEGLDLTTRQGREAYNTLLDIAPTFAALTNEATNLDQALARLTGRQGIFATLQDQVFVGAQLAQGNPSQFSTVTAKLDAVVETIRAGNIQISRNTLETNNILVRQEVAPQ